MLFTIYNRHQLNWLTLILNERIHNDIVLTDSHDGSVVISVKGESNTILVDSNRLFLQSEKSNLPCLDWDLDDGEWENSFGRRLPAPGSSKLD